NSWANARVTGRKVGTTSSKHGPYTLGYKHATMDAATKRAEAVRRGQSQKGVLSSDRRLQLADVKPESLVTAGQPNCGEYVPGPCTHHPSVHMSVSHTNPWGNPPTG